MGSGAPGAGTVALVSLALAGVLGFGGVVQAQTPALLPSGGQIVGGSGAISQSGSTLTITQSSQRLAADWQSFSIGAGHTVNFVQPNTSAVALNRVLGTDVSVIQGALNANGQVFLVNPNGILFTPSAQVDVGGLVASTLQISTADFMAGQHRFSGNSTASVHNQGQIQAAPGGHIALIAARIVNDGSLSAPGGQVLLGAGSQVTLDLGGPVKLQVSQGALQAQIDNAGAIRADGGLIYLSARAVDTLTRSVINHSGLIEASSLSSAGGRITLEADAITLGATSQTQATGASGGGQALIGGDWQGSGPLRQATTVTMESGALIDVSATQQGNGGTAVLWSDIHNPDSQTRAHGTILAKGGAQGGDGGRIETSGHWLDVRGLRASASAAQGAAGQWLLDPYNVTIAGAGASGTAYGATFNPGADSTILASDIVASLEGGTSVTITTGTAGGSIGDITVSSAITKNAGAADVTLTLQAANTIVVDQAITHTGGAGKLNVVLDADNDMGIRNGNGIIILNNSVSTGGGNISFGTGATMSINGVTTKVGGDVYVGGSGAINLNTNGGNVTVNGEMIIANPSGLTVTTNNGNVTFGGILNSGNSYAYDNTLTQWNPALIAAKSGTGAGAGDAYLATITSRLENAVVSRTANYQSSWLGGYRGTTDGTTRALDANWRWVSGPEGLANGGAGTIFFTQIWAGSINGPGGNGTRVGYTNWTSGEPNNCTGFICNSPDYTLAIGEPALQFTGNSGVWNDFPDGIGRSLSALGRNIETNLAASPLTVNAGTGTVTFAGAVGTLKSLATVNVTASIIAVNGGAVTTEGAQTYTGNVTLGSASTVLTQTNANTDFTLQANRSITNATSANASLLIKTTRDINLASASSISSSSGALAVTLNSDSDASGTGAIRLQNNASVASNGGDVFFGGGTALSTGFAAASGAPNANGVELSDGATVAAGAGNVTLRGSASADTGSYSDGVRINGAGSAVSGGNITIVGQGSTAGASDSRGVAIGNGASVTGSGAVSITGTGGAIAGTGNHGVAIGGGGSPDPATISATGTGTVTIVGTGGGTGGSTSNDGINILTSTNGSAVIRTASGALQLTGTAGVGSDSQGIDSTGVTLGQAGQSGATTLNTNSLLLTGSNSVLGTGAVTIQSLSGSAAFDSAITTSNLSLASTLTGLTIGKTTNTADVTVANATSIAGPISIYGGNVAIDAALTATGTNTVTLKGTVSVTDGASGYVVADKLALLGGNVVLDHTSNNVSTLAANTGSVAFFDSNTLAIGTVGATNGITATAGTVRVETGTGDITISQNLSASNTGTSAIIVNAGKSAAAGTSTGGNIVLSGTRTFTTGAGGRANLYSGDSTASTGLSSLVTTAGGTLTYNADEATTPTPTGGVHAIYRGSEPASAAASSTDLTPTLQNAQQLPQLPPTPPPVVLVGTAPADGIDTNTGASSGLVMVPVSGDAPVETGTAVAGGADPLPLTSAPSGVDPAGFMRVFVVRGGVNLPPQALAGVDDPLNPPNRRNTNTPR